MSNIEQFAKIKFNINLTFYQMSLLRAWSTGSPANVIRGRKMGVSTAKKVYYAYLQDGVEEKEIYA
jgi:hypothetical protein